MEDPNVVADGLRGEIDALNIAVRSLIASLSDGDTREFSKRFEANLQELRDRMLDVPAQERYFESLDSTAAYLGNAIRRIPG